jgi:hypothetical protein
MILCFVDVVSAASPLRPGSLVAGPLGQWGPVKGRIPASPRKYFV